MRLDGLVAEASLQELGLLVEVLGDPGVDIRGVTMDSQAVRPGSLFACVPGQRTDGHLFAPAAVARGAVAVLAERQVDVEVPHIVVKSVRAALGPVSDAFYGHPSRDLIVAGVTGTNGKTTTCALLDGIFRANGWTSTTIGTLTHRRTTPEAPELAGLSGQVAASGGHAVAMEVSSHALDQHRTDAVRFAAGVFTNLTPDHLDYHHTMDVVLRRQGPPIRTRPDPRRGRQPRRSLGPEAPRAVGRPWDRGRDLRSRGRDRMSSCRPGRSRFRWDGRDVTLNVGGRFNVLNAMAAATCARAFGIDSATIEAGLESVAGVAGRFELVHAGQPFTVIVDYAHTPDGLAQALEAARELTDGNLIVVFGAGGDRDHDKRPLMGAVAADLADLAVFTSDNPRSEDPGSIIDQVVAGAAGRENVVVEPDRAAAIAAALANANPGDVVVIAGKGHERGQDIGGAVLPFDDVEVARAALQADHGFEGRRRMTDLLLSGGIALITAMLATPLLINWLRRPGHRTADPRGRARAASHQGRNADDGGRGAHRRPR